jgi:hypothetical protein
MESANPEKAGVMVANNLERLFEKVTSSMQDPPKVIYKKHFEKCMHIVKSCRTLFNFAVLIRNT